MKITFWGTRGSIPAPMDTEEFRIKAKRLLMNAGNVNLGDEAAIDAYLDSRPLPAAMTFGGDTPCVEITHGDARIIFDCGTGIAKCGREMMRRGFAGGRVDILQTHTHWDHIMGFPFFTPAYLTDAEVHVHGLHPNLKQRFEHQMDRLHFPLSLDEMNGDIIFHQMTPGTEAPIGPFKVANVPLHHPGGSYAYRVTIDGKTAVFATDGEYTNLNEEFSTYVEFYRGADVLIFDAMYATLEKTIERENFGHSTPVIGINLALTAGVRHLFLFHHDPESNDAQIYEAYRHALRYLESERRHFPDTTLDLRIASDMLTFKVK